MAVPFFFVYGILYASASDSRWHETSHGTAFKSQWMNKVVYQIASFMGVRSPTLWRWSHARHHTDTLIVGRDREIAMKRPMHILRFLSMYFKVIETLDYIREMANHAVGKIGKEEKTFVPETEYSKMIVEARIHLTI